ncbi:MAG: 50S ribosomal protein L5, partial [Candidatus Dormibacteraeota bacterium]|nr:50S ribosomal protein L5 [Candidatus Dormibacteraeota bacterium]
MSAVETRPQAKPSLLQTYEEQAVPSLVKEFDYGNPMEVPRVAKVIVNIGIGEAKDNARALEAAVNDVRAITGQQPIVIKARKSV